jgi:hypothetical protein
MVGEKWSMPGWQTATHPEKNLISLIPCLVEFRISADKN